MISAVYDAFSQAVATAVLTTKWKRKLLLTMTRKEEGQVLVLAVQRMEQPVLLPVE